MYILKYCFQNFRVCPLTIIKLIEKANNDIILEDTKSICKTKTIGDKYYLIREYNRIKHKYNYIKVFEKV